MTYPRRQGQFMVYSSGKKQEENNINTNTEQTIIERDDYKFKVKKTYVPTGNVWHLEFFSEVIYAHRFEVFLTDEEIKQLKDLL